MLLFRRCRFSSWRRRIFIARSIANGPLDLGTGAAAVRVVCPSAATPALCDCFCQSAAQPTRTIRAWNESGELVLRRAGGTDGRCHLGQNNITLDSRHSQTTLFNHLHPSLASKRGFSSRPRGIPRMSECATLEKALNVIYDNLNVLGTRDLVAFWTVVPRLLKKSNKNSSRSSEYRMVHRFDKIFNLTMEDIKTYDPRDLATVALNFAKITGIVGNPRRRFQMGTPRQILRDLLVGQNSEIKQRIFHEIATVAMLSLPEFDARHLSNLIYAYGLAKHIPKFDDGTTILDILGTEAMRTRNSLRRFAPQGLSNVLWAYATTEETHPLLFKRVAEHIIGLYELRNFKPQSLSNIVWAYAKTEETHPQLFKRLAEHIIGLDELDDFRPQGLSNIVWAYATAEETHPRLYKRLAEHIDGFDELCGFKPQHLSNIAWAYATAKESHPMLFKKMAEHITRLERLDGFKPQELSMIVWAYATANDPHPQLFKRVAEHVVRLDELGGFDPQALSNILLAYATAEESHPQLFNRLADHIIGLDSLCKFGPQALSNIVWSYATTKESHHQLFQRLAEHIIGLDNLCGFNPQELCNVVWAYATAEESHPKLFWRVAEHIIGLDNLCKFDPRALSNIVWAYATADEPHPVLFKRVGDHIIGSGNLCEFKPQALSNIVWSYATANEAHLKLFTKLGDSAIRKRNEFNSQGVANFLWAFASNGLVDQHLFSSFAPIMAANLNECNGQDLSNVGWAFAVASADSPSLFNDEFVHACLEKEVDLRLEGKRQLHQWQLWREELNSSIRLPPSLQTKCLEAFLKRAPTPSALQNDVISQLSSIGLKPEQEVLTKSGYRLDALVEVNEKKIGIEVDGPFHFLGRRPNGRTILKRRQVTNLEGIEVISVPYWEWNKLTKDSNKKQLYLRTLFHTS